VFFEGFGFRCCSFGFVLLFVGLFGVERLGLLWLVSNWYGCVYVVVLGDEGWCMCV